VPIYEYKCKNGHLFDVIQRMSDDALSECQVCGAPVQRVFHPVAVHFKGSGFYNTDYGTRRRSREATEEAGASDGASKSDTSKPDSGKSESGKSESGKTGSSAASAAAAAD
jgi:putative FmdB family regulatory protein